MFFIRKNKKFILNYEFVRGALAGMCIGESIGFQIKQKSIEELNKFPVEDFLGFGDNKTWGGENLFFFEIFYKNIPEFDFLNIKNYSHCVEKEEELSKLILLFDKQVVGKNVLFEMKNHNSQKSYILILVYLIQKIFSKSKKQAIRRKIFKILKKYFFEFYRMKIGQIEKFFCEYEFFNKKEFDWKIIFFLCIRSLIYETSFENFLLSILNKGYYSQISGSIAGFVGGFVYGYASIPQKWIMELENNDKIINLTDIVLKKSQL